MRFYIPHAVNIVKEGRSAQLDAAAQAADRHPAHGGVGTDHGQNRAGHPFGHRDVDLARKVARDDEKVDLLRVQADKGFSHSR